MKSGELYALFREDVQDLVDPFLWSPLEIYAYMDDAYYMYVRLTGGIPDVLSDACTIEAKQGEIRADLHPSVLHIREAKIQPNEETVRIINAQDLSTMVDDDYGVLRQLNMRPVVGRLRYMVIGEQEDTVRWGHIPDRDYTVQLLIDRLPLKHITKTDQKFEGVKDHHHLHFLNWMKHLAYMKQDAETFNKSKSAECKAMFEQYCSLAIGEKDRYKHKVRVVRYGGL